MHTCVLDWITKYSLVNKRDDTKLIVKQSILNFSCLIALIIIVNYFRKE